MDLPVAQQKVHGVEDVPLDCVGRDGNRSPRQDPISSWAWSCRSPCSAEPAFLKKNPGHPETSLWPHRQHRTLCGRGPAPSGCPNCPCRTPSCQRCCPLPQLQLTHRQQQPAQKTCQSCVRAGSVQVLPALRSTKMSPRARRARQSRAPFQGGSHARCQLLGAIKFMNLLVLVRTCSHRTPMLTLALHSKMCEFMRLAWCRR